MIFLADKIVDKIDYLKAELSTAISHHRGFVRNLEKTHFYPALADCSFPYVLGELAATVEAVNDELKKYVLFDSSLAEITDDIEEDIGMTADRFMKWSHRTTVTTKEAMAMHNRSKSTIYRWIQSGKLNAVKVNGRWVIDPHTVN